jgi:putative transposase
MTAAADRRLRSKKTSMARLPRLYAPGHPQHLVMRCVAERRFAIDDDDYAFLADLVMGAVRAEGVALHAFVLLPREWRLVATPVDEQALARVVQSVGRRFAPHANARAGASGALWDRRYRSTVLDANEYLLPLMAHIEALPMRAAEALDATTWRWSSLRHHLGLERLPALTDHAAYWELGNTPFERQAAYRRLADEGVPPSVAERMEGATEHGWLLGGDAFAARLAGAANRRVLPLARGRRSRS